LDRSKWICCCSKSWAYYSNSKNSSQNILAIWSSTAIYPWIILACTWCFGICRGKSIFAISSTWRAINEYYVGRINRICACSTWVACDVWVWCMTCCIVYSISSRTSLNCVNTWSGTITDYLKLLCISLYCICAQYSSCTIDHWVLRVWIWVNIDYTTRCYFVCTSTLTSDID
jgi:hypothetical protein